MKILNREPFCLSSRGDLGIAIYGPFASSAWRLGDKAYNTISGNRFAWYAPDGKEYEEHSSIFSRPTDRDILTKMTSEIKRIAIEQKLISE